MFPTSIAGSGGTSETSLEGWKRRFLHNRLLNRNVFRNFLRGMETAASSPPRRGRILHFRNFLRGMETREHGHAPGLHAPSETSLEGWKLVLMKEFRGDGDHFRNFLRGMETWACRPP